MSVMRILGSRVLLLVLFLPLAGCLGQHGEKPEQLMVAPGETLLQLSAPRLGAHAAMKRVGVNGGVETWMSQDRVSLSLDRGVLVATRGFGFDMMGGDATATLAALVNPDGSVYTRRMRYLAPDNQSAWIQAGCTMRASGQEGGLQRYSETCQARRHQFSNTYWLDGSGRILRSAQWASAETGMLEIGFSRQ